jgi:RHS repeat-associated protein
MEINRSHILIILHLHILYITNMLLKIVGNRSQLFIRRWYSGYATRMINVILIISITLSLFVIPTPLEDSQTYSVTIDYDYDPLNRLTGASYSSGEVYAYAYDKVGNRSSQISPDGSTSYEYDEADRLVQVNDVDYSWDDNGNLLSDSVYTYTYDYDNHLTSANDGIDNFSFAYNALGDRYQQTANGETITYTLDIASDLSQVLMDGSYTYLYGLGRLAQENDSRTDYFLPDALGSVRQLTTQDGNIGLTQSFDPFGEPFSGMRPDTSNYGYAGEWTDTTGLQFLRARYYSPSQGRFLSHDPFPGLYNQPSTLNPYVYALNNPLLYTDPSGENPLLIAALIGGLIGGGINLGMQLYNLQPNNLYQVLHCVNWGSVAASFGAGAVAGLVGFGVFGATTAVLGTGFWATVGAGALSGVLAGHYARLVGAVLSGQSSQVSVSSLGNITLDAIMGGVGGAISYGLQRGLTGIAKDIMQRLTNSANEQLAANPGIAHEVLTPLEYSAGQTRTDVARMGYGKAVERLVRDTIEDSFLTNMFEHVGGPNKSDFIGRGIFTGLQFDITTPAAVASHMARPYGQELIILPYNRPLWFSKFP